jgi:hypothetical protein
VRLRLDHFEDRDLSRRRTVIMDHNEGRCLSLFREAEIGASRAQVLAVKLRRLRLRRVESGE